MGFIYLGIYQVGNLYFFDTYLISDQFLVNHFIPCLDFCTNFEIAGSPLLEKGSGHGHLGKSHSVQIYFSLDDH